LHERDDYFLWYSNFLCNSFAVINRNVGATPHIPSTRI
jgi:hypothetical protein